MLKIHCNRKHIILFALILTLMGINAQNRPSDSYYQIENNKTYTDLDKIKHFRTLLEKLIIDKNEKQYGLDLTGFSRWLYQNEHYEEGILQTKKAINFYKSYKPYNSKFHLYNLNLLASFYSGIQDYTSSNKILLKILKNNETKNWQGKIYRNIAENYHAEANYHTATNYFLKASVAYRKEKRYRKLFDNTLWLSKNYQNILDDTSTKKGITSIKELDTLKPYIEYNLYDEYLINERLGNLYNYESLFHPCTSLPYYKKALSIAEELKQNRNISLINNNIGYVYRDIDNDSALFYFTKALSYSHNDNILNAQNLYSLGLAYLDQEKYDLAYNYLNLSLNKLKIDQKISKISDENSIKLINNNLGIQVLKNMAITKIKQFEVKDSKELLKKTFLHLKQADQLIDLIKLKSTHQESKLFWRGLASDIYINLVKVCYLLNDTKLAYHYLEKNKSLLLLEDLTKERSKTFFNIPDNIIRKELSYKQKMASIKNKSLSKNYTDKSRSLELFDINNQYKSFIDSLQYSYPKYYQNKEKATILPFKDVIKKASKTNTSFVHYILNDQSGYGLIISKNKQELFEIQNIPLLQKNIGKYNLLVSKPFSSKTEQKEFLKVSKELYKNLFPKKLLKKERKKIIFIPDDNLLSIPFEGLLQENNRYLIEDYDISYAYSISFLEQNKDLKRAYEKEFLGFAPIDYNNLSTLINSSKEINTIATKFKGDILFRKEASNENLINSLSSYKIIHLSTHANANDSITPWIATSTKNITLNDIYSTKNNAELVTLSACNTSIGKLQKGEGVMSLARGFFNTGANSVVSTLWKADDQSTQKIITNFYTYLKKGKSKPEALRQAKLEYLKNHSLSETSPYYWSSLILIGDPDPMYSSINIWYILIGILLSSLFIFLFYKKK
ncbi:CHAT domain-containing protein [Aquimarina sp. Aq107]|uniref:CHAT domain-containing protein n=1 Tax=Aquimarina sp. Aq107 TaxID=1191912 RepID=UPI000D557D85|nr:CHAT domain-containing protein [Aquimarina sp. Aq107]